MEINPDNIEMWMDQYFTGKLNEKELQQLLLKEGIEDYEALLNNYRAVVAVVQRYEVLQQVQQVHVEFVNAGKATKNTKSIVRMPFSTFLKYAALVIFIIAGAAIYSVTTNSASKLYSELSENYHAQIPRTETAPNVSPMIHAFNKKNYKEVITYFEALHSPSSRELFLGGYAYLQTGNNINSINTLKKIIIQNNQTGNFLYEDEAEYYLGLAYLRNNQYDEAYNQLQKIYHDKNHTYDDRVNRWVLIRLKWLE